MTRFRKPRLRSILIALGLFVGSVVIAAATVTTYQYKDNLGAVFNIQLWQCVSGPEYCTGMVLEDSSGNEKGIAGNPVSTSETAAQGTPGSTAPSKGLFVGGVYNSSAPSPSSGQYEPLQLDASGRVIVSCGSGCGGSGGTSLADEGTFTQGTTSFTPLGGFYNSSPSNLTSGQGGTVQLTIDRMFYVNIGKWGGTALGAPTAWGSAPSGNVPGFNGNILASVLPTNAATATNQSSQITQETATATVAGTISDSAYAGSGNSTLSAALRGVYAILSTINTNIQAAIAAGSNFIGYVGNAAFSSNGWTPKHFIAANSDNATSLKASAGVVHAVALSGVGSAPAYLKFYDTASTPSCGSTAVVKSMMIPAANTAANGAGSNAVVLDAQFSSGIGYCVVLNMVDTDDTSVAATTYDINMDWK